MVDVVQQNWKRCSYDWVWLIYSLISEFVPSVAIRGFDHITEVSILAQVQDTTSAEDTLSPLRRDFRLVSKRPTCICRLREIANTQTNKHFFCVYLNIGYFYISFSQSPQERHRETFCNGICRKKVKSFEGSSCLQWDLVRQCYRWRPAFMSS